MEKIVFGHFAGASGKYEIVFEEGFVLTTNSLLLLSEKDREYVRQICIYIQNRKLHSLAHQKAVTFLFTYGETIIASQMVLEQIVRAIEDPSFDCRL